MTMSFDLSKSMFSVIGERNDPPEEDYNRERNMSDINNSSEENITTMQHRVIDQIIEVIHLETDSILQIWKRQEKISLLYLQNNGEIFCGNRITAPVDGEVYYLLSTVLKIFSCSSGCDYFIEQFTFIIDLLTLLHTGSNRVQKKVITIFREIIKQVPPEKITQGLSLFVADGETTYGGSLMDHLISCISKSLRIQAESLKGDRAIVAVSTSMATSMDKQLYIPWFLHGTMNKKNATLIIHLVTDIIKGKMSAAWALTATSSVTRHIFALTKFKEEQKTLLDCLTSPILWMALGSLCVINGELVESFNQRGWQGVVSGEGEDTTQLTQPLCSKYEDFSTTPPTEDQLYGLMYEKRDHSPRLNHPTTTLRHNKCSVVNEEEMSIRIDLHKGCSRVLLSWMLAHVDQRSLEALIELHLPRDPTTGVCRFCGVQFTIELLAVGNVCSASECQEYSKFACVRVLSCGHLCGGYLGERRCLPCLRGCAGLRASLPQLQDEAAAWPDSSSLSLLQNEAAAWVSPHLLLCQDVEDMCMICFTDPLGAAPSLQLACAHVFHFHCTRRLLESRWFGPRITFAFSCCPICKEDIEHPALNDLLIPIRNLQREVQRKAITRLEYDRLVRSPIIRSHYNNNPSSYAMHKYAYYVCFKCKKAYFGGEAQCEAEDPGEHNPEDLVCQRCLNAGQGQYCADHGIDFMEYKCRYCCSKAVFFCCGDIHFCDECHNEFQRIRRIPLKELPRCPCGPKLQQLEGTKDDCPLGVQHPPTGIEYPLGCGICLSMNV